MITPKELASRLARDALGVCRELLPAGRLVGHEWCVGSTQGEAGDSLKIHVDGEKAGVWCDFASGDRGGDLLDLWREVSGVSMAETIRQVKSRYGISEPAFYRQPRKQYAKPEARAFTVPDDASPVMRYLLGRGLTADIIGRAAVVQARGKDGPAIAFRYYRDGEHVHTKFLAVDRPQGRKVTWTSSGTMPVLYGWHLLPEKARKVVLTEGEIDCLTLNQFGLPALSVPMGAGRKQGQWLEHEFDRLERFDEILIAMDGDDAGREARDEIIERLGIHRCRIVEWPEKDANDCLSKRHWGRPEFVNCLRSARVIAPEELANAADFRDDVQLLFQGLDETRFTGLTTPWLPSSQPLEFSPGALSVWTGYSGHGKTTLLNQVMNYAMGLDHRVCIASLEIQPARTLYNLTKQATATDQPSRGFIDAVFDFYADKLWLFKLVGAAKIDRVIEVFTYAMARYGVSHFVLDSLMMLDIPDDDYPGQKAAAQRLVDFAVAHGVHVHLVAHGRKTSDTGRYMGKHDVKGSGGITDIAANVLVVWANEDKQTNPDSGGPDAGLFVEKNRAHGWRGRFWLDFDSGSQQFTGGEWPRPMHTVAYSAAARSDFA